MDGKSTIIFYLTNSYIKLKWQINIKEII